MKSPKYFGDWLKKERAKIHPVVESEIGHRFSPCPIIPLLGYEPALQYREDKVAIAFCPSMMDKYNFEILKGHLTEEIIHSAQHELNPQLSKDILGASYEQRVPVYHTKANIERVAGFWKKKLVPKIGFPLEPASDYYEGESKDFQKMCSIFDGRGYYQYIVEGKLGTDSYIDSAVVTLLQSAIRQFGLKKLEEDEASLRQTKIKRLYGDLLLHLSFNSPPEPHEEFSRFIYNLYKNTNSPTFRSLIENEKLDKK